jgi:predicted PurR-regulated permease PerM
MVSRTGEIRIRALRLLKNSLILSFTLILLSLVRPELLSFINFEIGGFRITGEIVLSVISLVFIIYFGYFVLIDVKYFLDFISAELGSKERGRAKSVTYDIAGIISLILASQLITPFVASISDVGNSVAKGINIVLLAIGFFIVYHLATEIYDLIKKNIENLIEKPSKQMRKEPEEKTSKGETK